MMPLLVLQSLVELMVQVPLGSFEQEQLKVQVR
jgi:hypothetical protein